ncbi:hypothetical protein KKI24_06810 [bacterium]|nr:hypothetical protein [bacterium]
MKARNCCKTMEMELTAWKAIVYDIVRKMDRSSAEKKGALLGEIGDLHIMIEEMDERIEEIRASCAPETGIADIQSEREAYEKALVNVRMKANEAMTVLGAGDFGG